MSLVLQTTALKVVNKGGGIQWSREKDDPSMMRGHPDSGSEYVVFNCARCTTRNKQCMHAAAYVPSDSARLPFKCWKCQTVNEVAPPETKSTARLIVSPDDFAQEMAQRRRSLAGRH